MKSWMGLPRTIRLNATHFIIYVTFEEFMRVYEYAVSKPYGFLFIDTDPKEPSMRFRSGFNEFIGGNITK